MMRIVPFERNNGRGEGISGGWGGGGEGAWWW